MKELIESIKIMEERDEVKSKEYLTDGYHSKLHPLIQNAVNLANEKLIEDGMPNFKNIDLLKQEGYDIYPGEVDSFGWVTGCIKTSKGIIVFG